MTINSAVLRDRYSNLTAYRSTRFFNNVYAKTKAIDTPGGGANYVNLLQTLPLERTTKFSLMVRVKAAAKPVANAGLMIGRCNLPTNSNGWSFLIWAGLGYPYFQMWNSPAYIYGRGDQDICDNAWHQVIVTNDGSSTKEGLTVFVDGSSPTQTRDGTLSSDTLQSLNTTIFSAPTGNNLASRISEVALWTGKQLSTTEVSSVYNGGTSIDLRRAPGSSFLSNWWWCGDSNDTSQMIYDYVGNAHGLISGSVTIVTDS